MPGFQGDNDGYPWCSTLTHRPFDLVRPAVWKEFQEHASNHFSSQISDIVRKTEKSLLTASYDFTAGKVEGFGGRALFRPNVAMGTSQTALHDLLLEGMLRGAIGREKFEITVGEFVERRFGREMGKG